MAVAGAPNPLLGETTCGSLLQQLRQIWDEVGVCDEERDKVLLQLELECLDVYKRKVDQASKSRTSLLQSLADSQSELVHLHSALGENKVVGSMSKPENGVCVIQTEMASGTIKEQLAAIAPALEQLWKLKEERIREFTDVQSQIQKICGETSGNLKPGEEAGTPKLDGNDLSLKKLLEFQAELQDLQKEKSDRLQKVLDLVGTVHDLCAVLGMDFLGTITEIHPSLDESISMQSKSISDDTLFKLAGRVHSLAEEKKMRLLKVQELSAQLTDLWSLMDFPMTERSLFNHITCNTSSTVDEVTVPGALTLDLIEQAEVEVERLDHLKATKMKEIAFRKQVELEDIYSRAHIEIDSDTAREKIMSIIDSGNVEPSELVADMDKQILIAKEEALGRKEILEKVERWMSACEEERWLEDYNRDENRYSASRGAHLNLKRAEKGRVLVNKIPALVDSLVAKTRVWEEEHGISFMYDGVPLLAMLDEYAMLKLEREEEKRRMKDQRKFTEQLNSEPEPSFGSRPISSRQPAIKKVMGPRANENASNGTPGRRLSIQNSSSATRFTNKDAKRESNRQAASTNNLAMSEEEATSRLCGDEPLPPAPP